MSGVAITRSKSISPFCTFSARSLLPTISATRRLGLVRLVALGEDGDVHALAGAVREGDHAAHLLVRVARVDAEIHRDLDRLVDLLGREPRRILTASGSG